MASMLLSGCRLLPTNLANLVDLNTTFTLKRRFRKSLVYQIRFWTLKQYVSHNPYSSSEGTEAGM